MRHVEGDGLATLHMAKCYVQAVQANMNDIPATGFHLGGVLWAKNRLNTVAVATMPNRLANTHPLFAFCCC